MLLAQHRQAHTPGSPCGGKVGWMHTSARVIVAVYAVLLVAAFAIVPGTDRERGNEDRKSTRLNSSHDQISYAVFCLKKKNTPQRPTGPSCPASGTKGPSPDFPSCSFNSDPKPGPQCHNLRNL